VQKRALAHPAVNANVRRFQARDGERLEHRLTNVLSDSGRFGLDQRLALEICFSCSPQIRIARD
jgi:hypothetical protein